MATAEPFDGRGWSWYAAISLASLSLTAATVRPAGEYFRRFLGEAPPAVVAAGAALTGAVCLAVLGRIAGVRIVRPGATRFGLVRGAAASAGFAAAVILADVVLRYSEEINVPFPLALPFYPAIGFVAEIAFHITPLTLVLAVGQSLKPWVRAEKLMRISMVIVAIAEPTFQVTFAGESLSWLSAYTFVHVLAIAIVQLRLLWRYDFVSMFGFRLCYYALWHVLWGALRLQLLFR